jgi:hypothetical protein
MQECDGTDVVGQMVGSIRFTVEPGTMLKRGDEYGAYGA